MGLRLYKIAELLNAAKAVIRGSGAQVGTEAGADLELTINAAARMLQSAQVAAAHIYEQLDPQRADAARRDQLADMLGLTFEKAATPARGLIAITLDPEGAVGGFVAKAGTELTFPGTCFVDGRARTYRLLADATAGGFILPDVKLGVGSGPHKLIPQSAAGASNLHEHTLLVVKTDLGTRRVFAAVKSANADQTLDLINPISGVVTPAATNRLYRYLDGAIAPAECITPGKAGNAPPVRFDDTESTIATVLPHGGIAIALLLEMSGGGDAVGPMDGDTARVVRLIEDTLAMPPSFGNPQHWREIALSCPDVDLDDAIVYQHVRGTGSIDIVCIGRSGGVRASAFPDTNLSFCGWGNNTRRIGTQQAERVRAWCLAQASYFDDIAVHSVEWDWRGNSYLDTSFGAFLQSSGGVEMEISHQDGYGPDCGVAFTVTPSTRHASRIYPAALATIDPALRPGHRIWARVSYRTSDLRSASAIVVTEVLKVAGDGSYAEIADVSALGPSAGALDGAELVVVQWGTAGPLTQPCVDAVYAYYDQLGPGSYTEPPRSPVYVQHFSSAISPVALGHAVTRWPPEGRRWASSLRASELRGQLLSIEGVRDVSVGPFGNLSGLLDFDAAVFQTLACVAVVPRST